jgi:outer membrane protein TolC
MLQAEERAAERFREVAHLRWQRGAGGWMELLQATDRHHAVRQRRLESELETALALLEHATASGGLNQLPAWLGQD